MTINTAPHIRKAAVLIRSLDGETAAQILAELSPEEVRAIRAVMRTLGEVDPEEQADILAEMRHAGAAARENRCDAVELDPSLVERNIVSRDPAEEVRGEQPADDSFAFLKDVDPRNLAPFLAGEHVQTVAVVMASLDAELAARVLYELPEFMQVEVVERLMDVGTTDVATMKLVEHELAAWITKQPSAVAASAGRGNHAARVLAATQPNTRNVFLSKLHRRNGRLAVRLRDDLHKLVPYDSNEASPVQAPLALSKHDRPRDQPPKRESPGVGNLQPAAETRRPKTPRPRPDQTTCSSSRTAPRRETEAASSIAFDQLVHADNAAWSAILREVDVQLLKLALVGADDALIDRVASLFPKQIARQFRSTLHQFGPTRLSDVRSAQQAVAKVADRCIHSQNANFALVS